MLIALKHIFTYSSIDISSIQTAFPEIDILGVKIFLNSETIIIFNIYIPPSTNVDIIECFFEELSSLDILYCDTLLFLGDFNAPHLSNFLLGLLVDHRSSIVNNFFTLLNLRQFNSILNNNQRLLDLVFANVNLSVTAADDPIYKLDPHHPPLLITLDLGIFKLHRFPIPSILIRKNYRRVNYVKLAT